MFSVLAAVSNDVWTIIDFRAGWGLGNALFISTALATIVGAASGGTASAIILYEAALGLGIAIGPLVGGLLGSVSWRGPFFGVTTLMAIAFIAVVVLLKTSGLEKPAPTKLSAPFRALAHPALAALAATALFYNIGFFVLLAYTPFPLGFGALGIGFTFFGWGVGLAITSVWVAPMLTARMRRTTVLRIALPLLALDLFAAAVVVQSQAGLIVCVVVGGLVLGVLNTVLTECVMEATDLPRSVASSAYSAVRFIGGAIAPPVATLLADAYSPWAAYVFAGTSVAVGVRGDARHRAGAPPGGRRRGGLARRGRGDLRGRDGLTPAAARVARAPARPAVTRERAEARVRHGTTPAFRPLACAGVGDRPGTCTCTAHSCSPASGRNAGSARDRPRHSARSRDRRRTAGTQARARRPRAHASGRKPGPATGPTAAFRPLGVSGRPETKRKKRVHTHNRGTSGPKCQSPRLNAPRHSACSRDQATADRRQGGVHEHCAAVLARERAEPRVRHGTTAAFRPLECGPGPHGAEQGRRRLGG